MNDTVNNEPCCEAINIDPSCSCSPDKSYSEKLINRKMPKVVICLVVLLAAVSIVAIRLTHTNSNNNRIVYSPVRNNLGFLNGAMPVDFSFGQPALETTLVTGNTIQAEQNLGYYVQSLDELNIIACDNDTIILFIPASENTLIDDTTKAAVFEFQNELKRNNIGLYTLWHDTPDYSNISMSTRTPAIIIARNGRGTITMTGNDVTAYMLIQAFQKAANKNCCEYYTPGCC